MVGLQPGTGFGRAVLAGAAAVVVALLAASPAAANGRIPEANQLVVSEEDPNLLLLRVTFGILVSHDAGTTWDWICESAAGYGGTQDPSVAILAGGHLVAGIYEGLLASPDTGCSWSAAPELGGMLVVDVAARPGATSEAVAVTNLYARTDDGGTPLYDSRVYRTTNAGGTWGVAGPALPPSVIVDTVELARSNPLRLVVSGKQPGAVAKGVLYVSDDGGQSYATRDVPFEPGENGAYVAAIDPKNAERIYVRTLGTGDGGLQSRLLVTDDAGRSFTERWRGGALLGFALSPDGSRVYLGTETDGLFAGDTTTFAFVKRQSLIVRCLATKGDRLYACSSQSADGLGFALGASTDDGVSFAPLLRLADLRGPLACPKGTSTAKCAAEWPALASTLGIPLTTPDAGVEAAGPVARGGCACESAPARDAAWPSALLAAALALVVRTWRKRR